MAPSTASDGSNTSIANRKNECVMYIVCVRKNLVMWVGIIYDHTIIHATCIVFIYMRLVKY